MLNRFNYLISFYLVIHTKFRLFLMAFPTSSAQQAETNRKILEEIQTKKQLLIGLGSTTNQVNVNIELFTY